jgi:hypothetical protein
MKFTKGSMEHYPNSDEMDNASEKYNYYYYLIICDDGIYKQYMTQRSFYENDVKEILENDKNNGQIEIIQSKCCLGNMSSSFDCLFIFYNDIDYLDKLEEKLNIECNNIEDLFDELRI